MPKEFVNWLVRIGLTIVWLVLSFVLCYVACVAVVLQISTRATTNDPLSELFGIELLAGLVGLVAIWLIFRFLGRLYELITHPPKSGT